jgi:serralysin
LLVVLLPAPPTAAAETCHGQQATITGDGRIAGTPGADVIVGGPGHDRISAGGGEDVVCGGGGEDTIDGGPGRDELDGQDGSDVFHGRDLAQDVITGGVRDRDAATYEATPAGIRLNLGSGQVKADGARFTGGLLGIEVVKGSAFADHLVGSPRRESLFGFGGNDVVDGRGGDDVLDGSDDVDTVSYASAKHAVRISVEGRDALVDDEKDELRRFEIYVGTRFGDRLVGSEASERFEGGPGDDTIKSFEEGDNLLGGPGDDTLFPGQGDDVVDGGDNDPVRATGAPGDLVSYADEKSEIGGVTSFDFEAYLGVNGFLENPAHAEGVGYDLLVGIESVRAPMTAMSYLEGDAGPNVLIGSNKIDVIEGLGGNDLLFGLGANDSLSGDDGDDYLDGGKPDGPGETDKLDGDAGDDTCIGANASYRSGCETAD